MRKILILFTIILLTVYITGCSQNINTVTGTAVIEQAGQTPAAASQQETPQPASKNKSAELLLPATQDLSYADTNKYPGLNTLGMVEDKTNVYYFSDAGISRLDKQTGKAKVIYPYKGNDIDCLSVENDQVYFVQGKVIKSMDPNGNNVKTVFDYLKYMVSTQSSLHLFDSRAPIPGVQAYNGLLYIWTLGDNGLANVLEFDPTNGTLNKFIDNASTLIFNGNYAYYLSKDINIDKDSFFYEIYRMNLLTKEKELVIGPNSKSSNGTDQNGKKLFINNFVFVNDQLYFTGDLQYQPYKLYKYNNGSIEELFMLQDMDIADDIIEYSGNIYFISALQHTLYKYDPKNEKCTSLSLMQGLGQHAITIINDTVIYPFTNVDNAGNSVMRYIDLKNFG